MSPAASFEIAPGLRVSLSGSAVDVRHFEQEYGACQVGGQDEVQPWPTSLDVAFGRRSGAGPGDRTGRRVTGGHKTVGWDIEVSPADRRPAWLRIALRGRPGSFARSLVQGYYVEPLLSIVAAESGYVLLPAAGIVGDAGLEVLIGRSRAGKSTLAARALASGRRVIGDDQVIVDASGRWRPFPRRLRFYPDLRLTAPAAFAALSSGTRGRLSVLRLVATGSLGYVRPSLAVDPVELRGRWDPTPVPAARIRLLQRSPRASGVEIVPVGPDQAIASAEGVLADQRSRLIDLLDAGWGSRLVAAASREREILASAIAGLSVQEVRIPADWDARQAIEATARVLHLGD